MWNESAAGDPAAIGVGPATEATRHLVRGTRGDFSLGKGGKLTEGLMKGWWSARQWIASTVVEGHVALSD
ncbi:hypothetical protein TIFTF001_018719 [Ficus carica]|uniref:Uncharacterized protein n=1 Tax=Ficus carica TaxID=3494 RepID=A0AA88AVW0_FICCA|nr:hypothetical protein TIFTF001_018719 [Ficus carica]